MLSIACFIATAAMLFYVIRFRVHIHITYTPAAHKTPRRPAAARTETAARPQPAAMADSAADTIKDLTSAIANLGVSKKVARAAAVRAAAPASGQVRTFDEMLRRAIQFAQEAA